MMLVGPGMLTGWSAGWSTFTYDARDCFAVYQALFPHLPHVSTTYQHGRHECPTGRPQ